MKELSKIVACAAIALCSLHAQADLVIDDFTTAQAVRDNSSAAVNVSNGGVSDEMALPASDTGLGPTVFRTLIADKFGLSGDPTQGVALNVSSTTNRLGFSQDADNWGQGRAIYAGQLGGGFATSIFDLTTLDPTSSFGFTYRSDGLLTVKVIITDTTGVSAEGTFSTIDTNGAFVNDSIGVNEFDFSGFGSFDIGRIEILFNVNSTSATADIDLTITPIRNVPEPASIALVGLAMVAFAARRRSVRKVAA